MSKFRLGFVLVILAGPLLDLTTGFLQLKAGYSSRLTPGVLYRGGILMPVLFLLTLKLSGGYQKRYCLLLLSLFLVGTTIHSWSGQDIHLLGHAQRFSKIAFPFLGLGGLVYLERRYGRPNDDLFLWSILSLYGGLIAASILLLFLTGHGMSSYRQGFSSTGFFGSQNSLAFIFVTSLGGLVYISRNLRRWRISFVLIVEVLFLTSALLSGTRAAIVGVPLTIVLVHLFFILEGDPRRNTIGSRLSAIWLFVMVGALGAVLFQSWSSWFDVGYVFNKFSSLYDFGLLGYGSEHLRQKVPLGLSLIKQFTLAEHLFGVGDEAFLLTENDIIDVWGKFGLVILIPVVTFCLMHIWMLVGILLRIRDFGAFVLLLSLVFYLLHGVIAGHTFTIAQTNNLVMLVYFIAWRKRSSKQSRMG